MTSLRRFLIAERDVLCSKQLPSGKNAEGLAAGLNDTHSLRIIPALSGDSGVTKYEIPVIKESNSYTFTKFTEGCKVKTHSHDEGQLRIIASGQFNFIVDGESFLELEEGDWLYIPKDSEYSIETIKAGAILTGYGMSCKCSSDIAIKTNFAEIDEEEILNQVSKLNVLSWNYTDRDLGARHIGPMAQEFKEVFNVGGSDKYIDMVDANGIVLSAIKALNKKMEDKEAKIIALENQIKELKGQISR